jgi:hypothetical protein
MGVDEATLNARQDLREELETLETEVELNAARVVHEKLRRSKLEEAMGLSASAHASAHGGASAPASASTPISSGPSSGSHGPGSAPSSVVDRVDSRLDDDGCFDLLLRDWKTSVLKISNPKVEGKIGAVVKQLVTMVVQVRLHTHLYIIYTLTNTFTYTHIYTHTNIHTFTYIHTHEHTYIHTYIHTHHVGEEQFHRQRAEDEAHADAVRRQDRRVRRVSQSHAEVPL